MVGQWLGYRAPERLERLILCNTSAYMGPPESWDTRIATVRSTGMAALAEAILDRWFTPEFRRREPATVAAITEMLLGTDPEGYGGCCAAIRDMDLRKMLALIRTPTLVIAGDSDPATPLEHAELIVNSIDGARLAILPAAHLSNVEQPGLFADAVFEAVNRLG
jgi:3-oxoadipate enol-lactonase